MDDDDQTDSSIAIPLLIIALLLYSEAQGVRIFLQNQVKPIVEKNTDPVDNRHRDQVDGINKQYDAQVKSIKSVFKQKSDAAALPYNNRINALRKRRVDSPDERKYIYNQISSQEQQRSVALAPIAAEKAAALQAALQQHDKDIAEENTIKTRNISSITDHNTQEQTRYTSEISEAGSFAWIISAVILLLISLLGYVRVRINVKSGIIPLRNFTVLDAHGSLVERMQTAIGDALNRQGLRLSVALHRLLSPNKALESFDGTVITRPGQYNTPKGMFTASNTPAPPSSTQLLDEAYMKVFLKLGTVRQQFPGYNPSDEVINRETSKAMNMNGSYAAAPWDDPGLGKA